MLLVDWTISTGVMCIRNNKWIKIHIHIHSLSESELSNQFENFIYFPMGLNYYCIMWCNLIERNEVNAFVNFVIHFCWICWHSLLCPFEDSYTYKSLKKWHFHQKKESKQSEIHMSRHWYISIIYSITYIDCQTAPLCLL